MGGPTPTDPRGLVGRLSAIAGRTACTDAERRAARLLAREARALGRDPRVEAFWTRPVSSAVHGSTAAALGVAGSVASIDHQAVAVGLLATALVLELLGVVGWPSPLWLLMTPRASQNVVARADLERPVRLIVTAPIDVPREKLLFGPALARLEARARRALRGHLPGPHAVVAVALVALLTIAALRASGDGSMILSLVQVLPTGVVLVAAAGFAEAAAGAGGPGANAHASAAAVALALVQRLDAAPPRRLAVDLVLAGAGEPDAAGMRREVRARRRAGARRDQMVVLHLAPCGAGTPAWWTRDGRLVPLRYHGDLVELCAAVGRDERHLQARPHETRGTSGAHAAQLARWPAIAIGCVDADGVAPHAGEATDVPDAVDPRSLAATLELCLALVSRLDAHLAATGD